MAKGKGKAPAGNAPLSSKRGRHAEEDGEGGGKNARPRTIEQPLQCPRKKLCRDFLDSLNLDNEAYFNAEQDRCYCQPCAAHIPDVLEQHSQHGHPYEVPKGWSGFGLKVPSRAHSTENQMFVRWAVSFHGCPSTVLASILNEGQLMFPGQTLLDGTKLPNRLTRGGKNRIGLYTSPSIKYSELDIYTKPIKWQGHTVRVVLQCRQKMDIDPPELRIEGETIDWQRRFGDTAISQLFSNAAIERFTTASNSIIPYRVLVSMDIRTREQEEEDKKNSTGRLQAAINAKKATEARVAAAQRSKDAQAKCVKAQAKCVKAQAGLDEAQAALDQAQKAKQQAQIEARTAAAEEGPAAAAEKAAQDVLVSSICAMVTDQDILSTLQPVIQGLVLHQLTELDWSEYYEINWKTSAGVEGAAALAAAIASSSSLTAVDFGGE